MTLPTLYKATKTGATQVCSISTLGNVITVEFGQLDGKMQIKTTSCKGKNVGKSNETTDNQQADLEAKSKWEKKIKSGYSIDQSAPVTVQLPMKVKVWESKRFKPGFISTPKLNGVNATYRLVNNELVLTSRGGEVYPAIPHLAADVKYIMAILESSELNGELYIQNTHLQDITSAVKKPKELSKSLEFAIFDIADSNDTYTNRRQLIVEAELMYQDKIEFVYPLTGTVCQTLQDIEDHYNTCMKLGLEGTVIKDPCGLYKHNVRSSDQWKYKKTLDGEYKVTDFKLDKNNHPVYTCVTPEGLEFSVKRKGTAEERLIDAAIAKSNVGRWLNIEYETLSKDLKPLKPVGNHFRACNDDGSPLE